MYHLVKQANVKSVITSDFKFYLYTTMELQLQTTQRSVLLALIETFLQSYCVEEIPRENPLVPSRDLYHHTG